MPLNIDIIRMPPSNTNSVLIDNGADAVIFDPWGSASDWKKLLTERNLKLHAIYVTHGHYDHMSAIPKLGAAWHMHHADLPIIKWSNPMLFMQGYGMIDTKKNPPIDIAPGDIEILPSVKATVIHTPGHSTGGVCFYIDSPAKISGIERIHDPAFTDGARFMITGDTLFYDSVGRWDLPGGSESAIKESLKIFWNFPDDTLVIPGHGRTGTLSEIKHSNLFLRK